MSDASGASFLSHLFRASLQSLRIFCCEDLTSCARMRGSCRHNIAECGGRAGRKRSGVSEVGKLPTVSQRFEKGAVNQS